MAIDRNDYPQKIETGLWANSSHTIFLYRFSYEKKEHSGLIDTSDQVSWTKKDKVAFAKSEVIRIKNAKKENILNSNITLDNFVHAYFKLLPDTNYTKTRKSHYERYVSPYCGQKKVTELRQLHISHAIKKQEELGLLPRTIKQTLEVLSPALKKAIANRLISFNPLDGIKIKLPPSKKMVVNAVSKLNSIHEAIHKEFNDDPFYLAFFLFALQGRRKGEILTLRWEDINFNANYYVLRKTKNDEEQKIFLSDAIKENLKIFRQDEGWVFTSRITGGHIINIDKVVGRLKTRLKDTNFGIHYLRNVMVSAMAEQGLESMHLSAALGHNDPNTIKKYLTMNYLKSSEIASGVIDTIVIEEKERKKKLLTH